MSRPCQALAEDLARHVRVVNATRRHVDRLFQKGQLPRRSIETIYEGLLINAFTGFEGFLEDLFIGLLVVDRGLTSSRGDVGPRLTLKTHAIAREVVLGGKPYADWLPYERTVTRAQVFFRGSRPFEDLAQADIVLLKELHYLRNVIAHRSRHSWAQYQQHVLKQLPLIPRDRVPGGFLRTIIHPTPSQTRLEFYTANLVYFAQRLAR